MPSYVEECLDVVRKEAGLDPADVDSLIQRMERKKADLKARGAEAKLDSVEDELRRFAAERAAKEELAARVERIRVARRVVAMRKLDEQVSAHTAAGLQPHQAILASINGTKYGVPGSKDSASGHRMAHLTKTFGPLKSWLKENMDVYKTALGWRSQMPGAGRAEAKGFFSDVTREMGELRTGGKPGMTGNRKAAEMAKLLGAMSDDLRVKINRHGGLIGRLDGWIPQRHDGGKILGHFEDWRASLQEHLDYERTFADLYDTDWDPSIMGDEFGIEGVGGPEAMVRIAEARDLRIEEILTDVYNNITIGKGRVTANEMGAFSSPGNLADRFGQQRVLHFKDADAWLGYSEKWGRGNVLESVLDHVERMARALSLIEMYGTNPEVMLKAFLAKQERLIREDPKIPQDVKAKRLEKLRTDWGRREGVVARAYAEAAGETMVPHNVSAAKWSSFTRSMVAMAKLGAAVLSALPDVATGIHTLRFQGMSFGEAVRSSLLDGVLKKTGKAQRETSYIFDAFLDGVLGSVHSRFDFHEDLPGAMSSLQGFFHKATGLTQWTDHMKAGFSRAMSAHLGLMSERSWGDLSKDLRLTLRRYNIDEPQWRVLSQAVESIEDGKTYMVPEAVGRLDDAEFDHLVAGDALRGLADITRLDGIKGADPMEVIDAWRAGDMEGFVDQYRATDKKGRPTGAGSWTERRAERFEARMKRLLTESRDEVEMAMLRYYAGEMTHAVIESTDATRRMMYRGTRPGTLRGELLRFAGQFKSFPVAYTEGVWGRMLFGRHDKVVGNKEAVKSLFTTAEGRKDISFLIAATTVLGYASLTMKDLMRGREPRNPFSLDTLMAAMMQGGGAGIYGDFLFGRMNRFGGSLVETLAGPVLSGPVSDAANFMLDARDALTGKADMPWGTELKRVVNNMPWVNLWYTRSALDYMVLYNLQDIVDPGSVRRWQRHMEKTTGQEFWLSPR